MASKNSNRRYILLRYVLVILLMLLLSGAIIYKAIDTCIIHAAEWNAKVRPELMATREIMPERGDILAHDGVILATSMTYYQAVIDFSGDRFDNELFEKELPALCDSLVKYFPNKKTAQNYRDGLTRARDNKHGGYPLLEKVTGKDIERLATFPFLKEKKSKTGYYINRQDGGYDIYINFAETLFNDSLFLLNLDTLCQELNKNFPKYSAVEYKDTLQKGYDKRKKIKLLKNLPYNECLILETLPFLNLHPSRTGLIPSKTGGQSIERMKPYKTMASRAIGSLNEETQRGNSGLEKALDSLLFGVPGRTVKRQLPNGMTDWVDIPPQRGLDVKTTIDVVIQDITESALEDAIQKAQPEFGVAVVMEVATGEIKAMSNLTRLPNGFYSEECRNNAVLPYAPGSVVKLLTMMIALDDGIVGPNDPLEHYHRSWSYLGGEPIRDSSRDSLYLDVTRAMTFSSNIGLAQIAIKGFEDNPSRFTERIREVGFMEPFNLGIAGESLPYFRPMKSNREGRLDLSRMSYGYASMIPPVYSLALYNAIANDGKFVKPRLVKELIREGKVVQEFGVSYIREQICKPETVKQLQYMLYTVVNGGGTGKRAASNKVTIAGKTGTAKLEKDGGGYTDDTYRISFCGYFPYENPQYTCIVLLENPEKKKGESMPSAGYYCGGAVKYIAEMLYAMGRLVESYQTLPDTTITFHAGKLQGDIAATQTVLQYMGAEGNLSKCYDKGVVYETLPDVRGMGARDALSILESLGLKVNIQGQGKVQEQSITPGSPICPNATIVLTLK